MDDRGEQTIDLRINRFAGHVISSVVAIINNIPIEYFNFPKDVYSIIDKCQKVNLVVDLPLVEYVGTLRNDQRKQCQFLLITLMKHNSIDDIYNVLIEDVGWIPLAFEIKRNDVHRDLNIPYACNPDEDMQRIERKLHEYVGSDNPAIRKIRLKELVSRCMNNRTTMSNRERQEEINLLAVATRHLVQMSDSHEETIETINEMWTAVQHKRYENVSKFYAELVYHGREIMMKAEGGDVTSVRQYGQELERLCLKCTHPSIMPLFHQRQAFVLRTTYKATERPDVLEDAIQQCKQGLHFAPVLSEGMSLKFILFFILDMAQLLLRVNPDFTCQQWFPTRETLRTIMSARDKMDELERNFMHIMSTNELLAYNVCRARLYEFEDIHRALDYLDNSLQICERDGIMPGIANHIRDYKVHLVGRFPFSSTLTRF
ncbi:uncharacterized protein LOC127856966 [Dreissena polymorpha]|uniref:Uncharacterized protein n=1 Tax=Dreissena polymorpha TaxID=45954 RepID=A0A9D3YXD3_DREPO|nr:uncharacterized protein LOC127856966 [Dreissena polymorpha]KAH3706139.1 hypothetical protein DPMN_065519 [Dreissena polymorpha]